MTGAKRIAAEIDRLLREAGGRMSEVTTGTPQWHEDKYGWVYRINPDVDSIDESEHFGRVAEYEVKSPRRKPFHWGCFPFSAKNDTLVSGDCDTIEKGKRLVEEAYKAARQEEPTTP